MGPRTDPCGTSSSNWVQELKVVLILTLCHLSCKQLDRTSSASVEKLYACNLAMISLWFIVSKALDKSSNKAPEKSCLARQDFYLSISINKPHCVLKPLLYPHKNGERNFPV